MIPNRVFWIVLRVATRLVSATLLMTFSAALLAVEQSETPRDGGFVLEEVFVTVTKRSISTQDVAGSVAAISGSQAEDLNITNVQAVGQLIPNVHIRNLNDITIRGISKGFGAGSPVALHENGVYLNNGGFLNYDVDGIEVLRGPSGTVYGGNATGGAMNVHWARPLNEWTGGLQYTESVMNNLGERKADALKAHINIPIAGDKLMARLVVASLSRDGLIDNLLAKNGDDPYGREHDYARLYLRSEPTENLTISMRYVQEKMQRRLDATPRLESRASGKFEQLGAESLPADIRIIRSNLPNELFKPLQKSTRADTELAWTSPELPWLGAVDVNLILGHTTVKNDLNSDVDGTEEPIVDLIYQFGDQRDDVAEFRISSNTDAAYSWIAGYFYNKSEFDRDSFIKIRTILNGTSILGGSLPVPPPPGSPDSEVIADLELFADQVDVITAEAVFVSGAINLREIFSFMPEMELFFGVRNNTDNREQLGFIDITVQPGDAPLSSSVLNVDQPFDQKTGDIGIRWFVSEDAMFYAKYARGYKPGFGEQLNDASINTVEPELLDALEFGYKSDFFERRLRTNVSAFYYDYQDLQVGQLLGTTTLTLNAAAASIWGVELDATVLAMEGLTVNFSVGYLDASFDAFCAQDSFRNQDESDAGCGEEQGGPINLEGNRMRDAPEWSASLSGQYEFNLGDWGFLRASAKINWKDDFYTREFNLAEDKVSGYTRTDLYLKWLSTDQRYYAELYVENLEDTDDVFFRTVTYGIEELASQLNYHDPRLTGLRVGMSF